jgi:hypothetical protein
MISLNRRKRNGLVFHVVHCYAFTGILARFAVLTDEYPNLLQKFDVEFDDFVLLIQLHCK